jgi:hypothetical protein
VTWVHPSWRDLVIREHSADAGARLRFLERCGLDGLLLALSTGGGAAGERRLPLLVADADWDLLGDRLAQMLPELGEPGVFRVLAAVSEACAAKPGGWAERELHALAPRLLDVTRRTWDDSHRPVPVSLLASWHELAAGVDVPAPQVATTWIELLPTGAVDVHSAEELARVDEWMALVELLRERDADVLERFGFPDAQQPVLTRLVDDAKALRDPSTPYEHSAHAARVLRRLADLVPAVASAALPLAYVLQPPPERSWEKRARDVPAAAPIEERTLVGRVLADL